MISVRKLDKHYRSKHRSVHVLRGVDIEIPTGSFFTLLGPSGSGKSTTLRVVAGLERHDGGEIWLADRLVSAPARGMFVPADRRGLGMVFQSYAIWPHMTVFQNVAYPIARRMDARRTRQAVDEVLELVGLRDVTRAPASALSGGQQQRVALARALVGRPGILLLDEPLSNLDARLRERMRVELREIQRTLGITAIYVTHDRSEALSMSTQVAVMNRGTVEMVGAPGEIYARPSTRFTAEFLGPCNLYPGRVVERDESGHYRIDTAIGRLPSNGPSHLCVGDAAELMIRPEDVEVRTAGKPDIRPHDDRRTGVVAAATYHGDRAELAIKMGDVSISASVHPSLVALVGQTVSVGFPGQAWLVPWEGREPR